MRSLARRTLCGVLAAMIAAAGMYPAYADELQVTATAAIAVPAPVPAHRLTGTRFVIGLDSKVDYQIFALSNPNRVIVELPEVNVRLPTLDGNAPVGLVKSVRAGLAAAGKMRVVIDVTQPVIVENAKIVKDKGSRYRLSLAILPASLAFAEQHKSIASRTGLKPFGLQPPLPRLAESPKERAARTFKPVIVLDPGHGGMDSGAEKHGTVEKNVVLAFGLVLRDLLEKTGRYKVLMTRSDDTFIPARRADALCGAEQGEPVHRDPCRLFRCGYAGAWRDHLLAARRCCEIARTFRQGQHLAKRPDAGRDRYGQERARRRQHRQKYSGRSGRSRPRAYPRTHGHVREIRHREHGREHTAQKRAGAAGRLSCSKDGAIPVGADRTCLRHEPEGRAITSNRTIGARRSRSRSSRPSKTISLATSQKCPCD